MLLAKTIGLVVILSFVGGDVITFKPFIKSRYSLRDRRKTTTRQPLMKSNETAVILNHEGVNIQGATPQNPTHSLETTMTSVVGANGKVSSPEQPFSTLRAVLTTGEVRTKQKEKTTKNPETTTQTDWFYDYFAGDDENPRHI